MRADYDSCRTILKEEKKLHPDNNATLYLDGFCNFIETTFAEDPEKDAIFLENHSKLIDALEDAPDHPFRRFAIGELLIQKGMIELRLGNFVPGMFHVRRAWHTLNKNLAEHPSFALSKKSYYTIQALLSNIPDRYRGIVELLGYDTDQYKALDELNKLQLALKDDSTYSFLRKEVNLYRAILMHKLTESYEEAYQIILENTKDYPSNPVDCFVRGKMAIDSKKISEAINVLEHFAGKDCPFPYINYDLGNAYLYSLNKNCLKYFAHFIRQNPGNGLKKDTYLRLAWWYFLQEDKDKMDQWLGFVYSTPSSSREKDKVAVEEANRLHKTHPTLLKARLTFDGGFYDYSLQLLNKDSVSLTKYPRERIRYHYQKARIFQDKNSFQRALKNFRIVTDFAHDKETYFVPVAWFQMGMIYEFQFSQKEKAMECYRQCLSFKGYPYETTYSYKSKVALKRLETP